MEETRARRSSARKKRRQAYCGSRVSKALLGLYRSSQEAEYPPEIQSGTRPLRGIPGAERRSEKDLPRRLTDFMVVLKNKHKLDNNTVIHQMAIVAQFLKRYGKAGATKGIRLPERVISSPATRFDQRTLLGVTNA
jgi:hypothetical protein